MSGIRIALPNVRAKLCPLGLDPLKVHTNVQEPILRVAVPGDPSNRFHGLLGPLLCGTQTLSHWLYVSCLASPWASPRRDLRREVPLPPLNCLSQILYLHKGVSLQL